MYPASAPSGQPRGARDERSSSRKGPRPIARHRSGRGGPARGGGRETWRSGSLAQPAGRRLRPTSRHATPGSAPATSAARIPLNRGFRDPARPVSRPAPIDLPPNETRPRPVPSPAAPRIEPSWSGPRPEPTMTAPPIMPSVRAVTPSAARRPNRSRPWCRKSRPAAPVSAALVASDATSADLQPPSVGAQDDRLEFLERDIASTFDDEISEVRSQIATPSVPPSTAVEVEPPQRAPTGYEEPSPADLTEVAAGFPVAATSTEPEPGPDARPFRGGAPEARPRTRTRSVDPSGERAPRESSPLGQSPTPYRPIDRGPRKRRPPRDRIGLGRRGEPASRLRSDSNRPGTSSDREGGSEPSPEAEWPTVRDILANHRSSPGPRPAVERRRKGEAGDPRRCRKSPPSGSCPAGSPCPRSGRASWAWDCWPVRCPGGGRSTPVMRPS